MATKSSASSRRAAPSPANDAATANSRTVRFDLDVYNPPALTPEHKAELQRLAELPDETIDCSDIPPLNEEVWKEAKRNPFFWQEIGDSGLYRPVKKQTTVRLDADVLVWLRRSGKGWQTRLNAILRDAMAADSAKKK
jgi:uncharacterized protein (DUF4415 family)